MTMPDFGDILCVNVMSPFMNLTSTMFWQVILLEGAKATTETVDALRNGAVAMKSMQKAM